MPTKPEDYSKIKSYQDEAAKLTGQAGQYTAGSNVLGDKVMEAVRADRTSRGVSKLATDVGNVSGQMVTDPNAIREGPQSLSGQGLVDPFSVNALTSGARAQNLKTLGTISTQESLNQGGIDEVIQAGANQLKARAATLLAEAEKATAAATSLEQEYQRAFQEKQYQEGIRQFNETMAEKKSTGSGKAKEVKEEKPLFSPKEGEGAVSPKGEYIFYQGAWRSADELLLIGKTLTLDKTKKSLSEDEELTF